MDISTQKIKHMLVKAMWEEILKHSYKHSIETNLNKNGIFMN